ncbi:MAG: YggS family pyridoxal phosphate-dependent enzyme [bacterium]
MSIKENIQRTRARIARVCEKTGRDPDEIEIVAVSKTVGVPQILEAVEWGIMQIGENRVQEAWRKYQAIGSRVRWHMIGHLQTNKVKRVLQFANLIQSVDSTHLAQELQNQAEKNQQDVEILIEVNTSAEPTKFGYKPKNVLEAVAEIAQLPRVKIRGLMTVGAFLPDPEAVRPCFRLLRKLRDEISAKHIPQVEMRYLSMGMTDDFEVAVEEGSNMVRIGRAIFGARVV